MPPNSKKGKKKSKSKQHPKKSSSVQLTSGHNASLEAEVYDEEVEYPTSRVIKRAPNGDVIVESLPEEHNKRREFDENKINHDVLKESHASIATTLDSHWESLTSEEKRSILRIEKNDIFEVLRDYQITQSCTCSVCGRRHMSMELEMVRIYDTLYELDKEKDPNLNPVKFHLSIIKELQNFKLQQTSREKITDGLPAVENKVNEKEETADFDDMRDEVVKYFLSSNAVDTLKEEVVNFKQHKQQQYHNDRHHSSDDDSNKLSHNTASNASKTPEIALDSQISNGEHVVPYEVSDVNNSPRDFSNDNKDTIQERYLKFAKTFVSSHPKIAEEYVNRMMMYPDMRALTDDLMNNNGQEFVKAIEDFVMENEKSETDEILENQCISVSNEDGLDLSKIQHRSEAEGYTTIKHNGKELTEQEYDKLQHIIANSIVDSYDKNTDRFNEISPIERELFTRFIYGEGKKKFRHILGQTYNDRIIEHSPNIDSSLAAAAVTTASSNIMRYNDNFSNAFDPDSGNISVNSNCFDETYDEYSDYDHGEDELVEEYDEDDDYDEEDEDEEESSSDVLDEHVMEVDYDEQNGCINDYCNKGGVHHTRRKKNTPSDMYHSTHYEHTNDAEGEYDEAEYEEDDQYDSGIDEAGRIEEGRKLIQISITKLLQSRIMESYHEKQAETNRLKLLQELEAEEQKKRAKEEKKQKKREKEKERKKAQQLAKEEENRKKEQEAEKLRVEAEERETQRREAQRKKVEEAKRKKDEERKRKLEDQRRREEEQERQRKIKEEQKRKRDEERRVKEEEKRKREMEKRRKEKQEQMKKVAEEEKRNGQEQQAMEEMKKAAEDEIRTDMERKKAFDEFMPKERLVQPLSQPNTLDFSNASPNMPYGNMGHSLPDINSQKINDDIINIINSASASRTTRTSPSHLNGLLHGNNGIINCNNPNQPVANETATFFDTSSMLRPPNFSNENVSFDPLSGLNPTPPSIRDGESSVSSQNYNLPPWNTFGNTPASVDDFQSIQHPLSKHAGHPQSQPTHSHSNKPSTFQVNNNKNPNGHYLENEIDNLTKMLNNTGLNNASMNEMNTVNHSLIWGDQRSSISAVPSGNDSSLIRDNNNISTNTMSTLDNSNAPPISNPGQRRSIWDDLNNEPAIAVPRDQILRGIPNSLDSVQPSYSTSNIWGDSLSNSVSFLGGSSDVADISAHQGPNHFKPAPHIPNEESDIQDSIYKAYIAFSSTQASQYVPVDLLYQNSICRSFEYSMFIRYLMGMRISHGSEILTDSSGSITHARMTMTGQGIAANKLSSTSSRDNLLGDLYPASHNNQQTDSPSLLGSVNSSLGLDSQMFSTNQHLAPTSTLTSKLWS